MGFLNNTTVTVDAVLTKKGRELLAQGTNAFNITKFALADDEIDYRLYDTSHPNGTDFYGAVLEAMQLLEYLVTNEAQEWYSNVNYEYPVNAKIKNTGVLPGGYTVNHYLTDPDAFFLLTSVTDQGEGLKMFQRTGMETSMEPDFSTGNIRYKARERYSFGFSNWRGIYGSQGA